MRYTITGRNIEVTQGLREAVEDKLGKLEKYFTPDTEAVVTLSVQRELQKIEVTIPVKGSIIRAEESSNDMYVSIDLVEEVIERQLKKYKKKLIDKKQNAVSFSDAFIEKIEDDVIQRQLDKLAATKAANLAAEAPQGVEPQKAEVAFDDFQKMDIRVATILTAEKVAKTKKLLRLTVDTGIDQREIVSGIAEHFTPEELVGRQVLVLVNLQPRELKGTLSRGMILMAEDAGGRLRLLGPDAETIAGAVVG